MQRSQRASILIALLLLGGCATVPGQDRLAEKDPLEKFNRGVWGVNMAADRVIIRPVTQAYRAVAPKPIRQGVTNFFSNLTEPWSMVNNLLQGKPKRAAHNLGRFVVNVTAGLGGFIDEASKVGIPPAPEDLGQTLAVWGVNGGPYLVLPLLGPTTLRDAVGSGAAYFGDPVSIGINELKVNRWYKRGFRAVGILDARAQLTDSGGDAFLKSSLDPYAAARSAYLQRRRAAILDQEDSLDAGPPDDAAAGPPDDAAAGPPDPAPDAATPPATGTAPTVPAAAPVAASTTPAPAASSTAPAQPTPATSAPPPSATPPATPPTPGAPAADTQPPQ